MIAAGAAPSEVEMVWPQWTLMLPVDLSLNKSFRAGVPFATPPSPLSVLSLSGLLGNLLARVGFSFFHTIGPCPGVLVAFPGKKDAWKE